MEVMGFEFSEQHKTTYLFLSELYRRGELNGLKRKSFAIYMYAARLTGTKFTYDKDTADEIELKLRYYLSEKGMTMPDLVTYLLLTDER